MRHGIVVLAALWWTLAAGSVLAQADREHGPGAGPGNEARHPHPPGEAAAHHRPHHPHHRPWFRPHPPYYEPYPYGYPGYSYYPPLYDYVPGYYLPPAWMPAEYLYGPQAVQRFMGVAPSPAVGSGVHVVAVQEEDEEQQKPNLRGTNRQSLDLAWRFIGFGDAHFENQKYADANSRYRKAAQVAPQLGAGYFRQAFALIALRRYDAAAKVLKRGLAAEPGWPKSNFKLDEIYGANQMAKKSHVDTLAKEATAKPTDADLHFLLGVFLHADGQPQRARPFFQKALRLAAGNDAHIRAFP